jgi:D-tyrosyl-tRNA(Tyr) deacylase
MKLVISVVEKASITIDNKDRKEIWEWLLVYMWVSKQDCELSEKELLEKIEKVSNKLQNMQVLAREWKINTSLKDINWELLLVSNFTLYGKNKKWNKIDFLDSWKFDESKKVYDMLVEKLENDWVNLKTWKFGAYMEIESKNNWPLNYVLEF